jgi:hypothetical protein
MFGIGDIFKALVNPASLLQLAMGPAGWISFAVQTIGTAIGKELIQALGQQLGLPQSIIDMAKTAFSAATGSTDGPDTIKDAVKLVSEQLNLSPTESGQLERTANESMQKLLSGLQNGGGIAEEEEGGGSFLVALAKALGKQMDQKAAQISGLANDISKLTSDTRAGFVNGIDGNNSKNSSAIGAEQTKISSKSTLLQAYSQELSIISTAATNAIKSIGEAQTTLARKG